MRSRAAFDLPREAASPQQCSAIPFLFRFCLLLFALAFTGCPRAEIKIRPDLDIPYVRCGGLGERCCRPPGKPDDSVLGPLVRCGKDLGCDITTDKCVQPCGGTGQACCDGPETRAIRWTPDGKPYSPNYWGLRELCDAGACDIQTHRCFACGTRGNAPCCPPDAAQATARCIGAHVECAFNDFTATSGMCIECGSRGRHPCRWGCDTGLELRNGLCEICGADMQPPCDRGCNPGLERAGGLCRRCGAAGQIPCDRGCNAPLKLKSGLCAVCGGTNQAPCDFGCDYGFKLIGGVCKRCGINGEPPCANGCNYPMKPVNGICRLCGAKGQIPCESGCNQGLVVRNGVCSTPESQPPPQMCSTVGQPCVPDHQPGNHCCQNSGPQLCVYGHCKSCVPHGEVCLLGGTQICCSAKDGDICVLDQFTEQVVCGIPG